MEDNSSGTVNPKVVYLDTPCVCKSGYVIMCNISENLFLNRG